MTVFQSPKPYEAQTLPRTKERGEERRGGRGRESVCGSSCCAFGTAQYGGQEGWRYFSSFDLRSWDRLLLREEEEPSNVGTKETSIHKV